MADIYFSGQGTVYVADRDSVGAVSLYRDVGNVPALKITLETDTLEHKESRTGNRLTDLRLIRERRAKVTMTLENFSKANLMMLLYGTGVIATGASVTNEIFPTGLIVGDMVSLLHGLTSALSIVDSTGSPVTLTLGTHYTADLTGGMVTIKSLAGLIQPFKANYTYATTDVVPFFKASSKERFLKFSGLNTANSNAPVVVEIYRILFDPVGNIDLINDELAQFEIEGAALYDSTRDADATLGGFGRIIQSTGS